MRALILGDLAAFLSRLRCRFRCYDLRKTSLIVVYLNEFNC